MIFAGQLIPPRSGSDDLAIGTMNNVLGGKFTSRLNMNLRESKHWTYGARSFAAGARGQQPLLAYAAVQTDKTAEALTEIRNEIIGLAGPKPATPNEVALVKRAMLCHFPVSGKQAERCWLPSASWWNLVCQ